MQVRLEEFSSYDVCEGLLTMFRPMAEKKNIDLRSQLAPAIPLLRQDVVKLQQILSNLLSNAIKFTPEGGRVLLKAELDGPNILLTVTDTGVGIAPEEQELVFEKFRQSGNPLTREHAGTGLGLSIVRELSKLLGGEVACKANWAAAARSRSACRCSSARSRAWSSTWPTKASICPRRSASIPVSTRTSSHPSSR